ncbi:MAG: lipopolysaccharide transport periplasmic protein LptA [Burkholderiales bacterium 28-67-8]|nr:MAG: lipopolysaccharide transport periplasmic protein LptA [Burkholderiales bacterium 28-67-8]
MNHLQIPLRRQPLSGLRLARVIVLAMVIGASVLPAQAEKADRSRPLNVEADNGRYDDAQQLGVFTGNVVVTKGTLTMRASRIEVRQSPDGSQFGVATSEGGKRALFRQKREGLDEYLEGEAERIEYDGKADLIRFIDRAVIRRYRGSVLADETAGSTIIYDNVTETVSVAGGSTAATPNNPSGRVRTVLTPREQPAAPDASASQPGITLKPSTTLGGAR